MRTETCWSSFYNFNYFNNLRLDNKPFDIIDACCNNEVAPEVFDVGPIMTLIN